MTEFAGDRSNLFFLLMSVVECTRSRRFIRQSLASETTQQKFEKLQLQSVKLIAMYDLQGSWDLLVKYRADGADSSPRLVANIIAEILKEAKSEDDKMRKKPLFWQADLIDVARQSKSFRGLLELDPNEVVSYTRLASTAEYGVHRAQRSFLIMEAPDDDTQRRLFVEEIHELMALTPQLGGMKHELAHALFFMHPEYRRSVMSLLKCYDTKSMEDKLTMLGYCRQVLKDEVHAYVLAEPREIPEADRQRLAPLRKELQKLYRRYSRLEMT
ncbi:MAG: hypothetical protein O3C40_28475 [Planctomycetota bacterium]|nr:hypothetical protein [Planctomycetota bacterium]